MNADNKKSGVSQESLDKLVKHHMVGAFGAGLVPLPMVDFVAVSGVQLNLVRKLAAAYDVPFSKNAVTSIISSLAGGALPAMLAPPIESLIKMVPVVGYPLGAVSMPVVAAAMTYAIGNVFIQHFESDGTLLTFDIDTARSYFKEMYAHGEEIATGLISQYFPGNDTPDTAPEPPAAPAKTAPPKKAKAAPKKKTAAKKTTASKKAAAKQTKATKTTSKKVTKKTAKAPAKSASKKASKKTAKAKTPAKKVSKASRKSVPSKKPARGSSKK